MDKGSWSGFRLFLGRIEKMDVKGFLIDLDGVLYVGDQPVNGARESIDLISDKKYQFRFVSNTTRKCRKTIAEQLFRTGI